MVQLILYILYWYKKCIANGNLISHSELWSFPGPHPSKMQQQGEEIPRQPCNWRGWEVELHCKYISDCWYVYFQQDYHYGTLSEVPQDQYWYLDPFTKQSPWFTCEFHPSLLWIQTSQFCCIISNVHFYEILPVLLCVLWKLVSNIINY